MGAPHTIENAVVLFDGVCNLCNGSVQFIIKRDKASKFHFAALQSEYGQTQLLRLGIPPSALQSIVLIKGDRFYQRSNAVLEITKMLGGLWSVLYVFKIVPAFLRDWLYNGIANNRYKWFGRQDQCMIPTPALKARFLD
ncbi:MAG TPA: thiol-disulfide oxidoreductase DCC family protein [Cyclobacteriaceae bacterium]|nr:thiol-disulfide oxidoreductase DCC family protein [Cyclobacteriaceae bacterium]HRK53241.1 thiol-disulfide oxidoreductase DCC family protein [Cyclobacteriaceae bacterium]